MPRPRNIARPARRGETGRGSRGSPSVVERQLHPLPLAEHPRQGPPRTRSRRTSPNPRRRSTWRRCRCLQMLLVQASRDAPSKCNVAQQIPQRRVVRRWNAPDEPAQPPVMNASIHVQPGPEHAHASALNTWCTRNRATPARWRRRVPEVPPHPSESDRADGAGGGSVIFGTDTRSRAAAAPRRLWRRRPGKRSAPPPVDQAQVRCRGRHNASMHMPCPVELSGPALLGVIDGKQHSSRSRFGSIRALYCALPRRGLFRVVRDPERGSPTPAFRPGRIRAARA